jgi:Domain of unknown function (DUF4136)
VAADARAARGRTIEGASQRAYTEGTLILGIVDATSRALVWRGTATDVVADRADAIDEIAKAVRQMLDDFPPRSD